MTDRTCPACEVEHLGPLAGTLDACAYCGAAFPAQSPPAPACTDPTCGGVCASALVGCWCLTCGRRAYS